MISCVLFRNIWPKDGVLKSADMKFLLKNWLFTVPWLILDRFGGWPCSGLL